MQDNQKDDKGPAKIVRRHCKKYSPFALSCKGKRIKGGCDRGSESVKVHRGQREEPAFLEKPKGFGRAEN